MSVRYNCRAKVGEYQDRNSGELKAKYATIGVVLRTEKGFVVKLDTLPVNFDGTIFLAEPETPEQRNTRTAQQQQRSASAPDYGAPTTGGDGLDF